MNKKKIDAVKLRRDIRNKLQEEYKHDPSLRSKRFDAIRKKYNIKQRDLSRIQT
jgi:DNA-binding transcriptional regulator YiaG